MIRMISMAGVVLMGVTVATAQTQTEGVGGADWALPEQHLRDNGLRGEVILNAFWAGRAKGSAEVERVRVPDVSPAKREEGYEHSRELVLPDGWENRRLYLVGAPGPVTFNDQSLEKTVELPYGEEAVEIPAEAVKGGAPQRITIRAPRIANDIWLRSFPRNELVIVDSYITTSYRNRTVTVALEGLAAANQPVRPVVNIHAERDASKVINTLQPQAAVTADARGRWRVDVSADWADAKLWSPEEPNLYYYTVELRDGNDRLVDQVLPRSFGFREVWSDGRDVLMNGVPVRFTGDTWSRGLVHEPQAMEEQVIAVVRKMKAAGIRAGFRIDSPIMHDVADREGMLLTYSYLSGLDIPVDIDVLAGPDQAGDAGGDAEIRTKAELDYEKSRASIIRKIKQRREHPSILAWYIRSPWSRFTLHSVQQGITPNPWDYWPGNDKPDQNRKRYEVASRTIELIREIDPRRPISAQNNTDADIEHATRYLCDNLDLQERAEFFRHYAAGASHRVLWPSESDVSPFPGHNFIRKTAHQMPQGGAWPAIHVENAARLFGDSVYLDEPEEVLQNWYRMRDDKHRRSPVYQRLTAENFREAFRGWRTAGISHNAHWVLREGMTPSGTKKKIEDRLGIPREVDPRRPGLSRVVGNPDQPSSFPIPGVDTLLEGGEAYLRNTSPLMAYIGGGPDNVYSRDHLYTAGDPVAKEVVVLNDYMKPVHVQGSWELLESNGRSVHSGEMKSTVPAGARLTSGLPIRFAAPAVSQRTDYTLKLSLTSDVAGSLDDTFELTVFPAREKAPAVQTKVWHLPGRDFGDLLTSAGIRSTEIPSPDAWGPDQPPALPQPGDLLLIPRKALDPDRNDRYDGIRTLQAIGFDELVEAGLRVIVFEQDVPNLMGLQTESVRPRRVFMSAPGHPVFDGLQPSDLTYWSGNSNLQLPVGPISISENFPDRLWQVSNTNAVASRTLYRPQTGAARALAVSGFDLAETPLLEVVRGQGRMLFCQLDVSNRYGSDPVATRIVDNMIRYLAAAPAPQGTSNEVKRLPVDGQQVVEQKGLFRAAKPEGEAAWGITQAELFFRESLYTDNWVTKQRPEGIVPVLAGGEADQLPQVIRRDPSGQFRMTLDESHFSTGWAKRKIGFLRSALLINQGGTSDAGPALHLHGNATDLYPHTWVEGFVHPYTAACW